MFLYFPTLYLTPNVVQLEGRVVTAWKTKESLSFLFPLINATCLSIQPTFSLILTFLSGYKCQLMP